MNLTRRMQVAGLVLASIALIGLVGCGDAGGRAKNRSPVMMLVTGINAGEALNSDIFDHENGTIVADPVSIAVVVQDLDPDPAEDVPADSVMNDVILDEYRVEYVRNDTGTAVPATFSERINYYVPVDSEEEFSITVVRADQKMMIPLSYLDFVNSFGYEPDTGLRMIHCTAKITIAGKTISGHEISASGYLPVYFADWAEQ